ncbi:PhnD/SsuA/transferrin family substrate-binding protein [Pseudanabaena sp. 'Roaring Creek']|uniref:PhnD/SsuA/transferrin family substrate-binding protein n=1 Tax=Pseudanabaena sp. 'Roaring Creek' TaxID=1681830 RepID=UPI0006D775B2|nr:PhnD/SsuA/transferrin family substrate-binding protein [Pseudanabaena sp. 'Roaring Creek']
MNIQPNIPSSTLLQPEQNNALEAIAPQPTNKTFRIGVLAQRGIERAVQLWQPTADYLSQQLGYTFTIAPLDFQQINPSVANGEVDFIIANSSLYIEFETLYGIKRLATLKRVRMGKAYTVFGGVIFRRSDRQDIQTLQDLIGKNFAGANENSLGAWQAAWREFHILGIDPRRDFLSLQFTGTHDAVVHAVRDGLVDAGSVHTDTLEQMALEGKIHLEDFEIINQQTQYKEEFPFALSTRLYPEIPFAACRQVNNEISEQVAIALFQMNKLAPEVALAANSQGWTIPLSYASVHECLKELHLGIYAGKNELDFDLAVQGSNNGWWDWNIENNQTFYSTRWKEMLGYAEDEIVNHIREWEQRIHPDDRNLCLETLQNYLQGKIPEYQLEHRLLHKDGSYRWIISRGKILRDIHGQPYRMAGSHADITKRRLAEDALRDSESRLKEQTLKLEKALQDLQETQTQLIQTEKMSSLGQLVAGIAHEINNPVNFIHGNVNCAHDYITNLIDLLNLYRQTYPQPVAEIIAKSEEIDLEFLLSDLPQLLKSMQVGTERIAKIVLSLRSFSRLDEADRKAVDIHTGIDDTLLILQYNLKAKGNASKVNVIKDYGDLPLVECYAGQLNQVFMNILSNAIDAFPKEAENPTIRIKTELNSDRAIISISDNGTGMNSNVQKSLFNPFFTTKPVGQGTGLGLAISYQIVVEKHGGTLQCQSELDKGTEFRIEIPVNTTM